MSSIIRDKLLQKVWCTPIRRRDFSQVSPRVEGTPPNWLLLKRGEGIAKLFLRELRSAASSAAVVIDFREVGDLVTHGT